MKKVVNASIGGRSFTLEEDAYKRLESYLIHFRSRLSAAEPQGEVMDEIEGRIAELFAEEVGVEGTRVVTLPLVEKVAATLGMPDGSSESGGTGAGTSGQTQAKKLYRDPDQKRLGGVCSGLGWYLDVDVTLVRVLMLIAIVFGTAGFWVYIILWIVVPLAETPTQQCEMRGLPVTAENLARFTAAGKSAPRNGTTYQK